MKTLIKNKIATIGAIALLTMNQGAFAVDYQGTMDVTGHVVSVARLTIHNTNFTVTANELINAPGIHTRAPDVPGRITVDANGSYHLAIRANAAGDVGGALAGNSNCLRLTSPAGNNFNVGLEFTNTTAGGPIVQVTNNAAFHNVGGPVAAGAPGSGSLIENNVGAVMRTINYDNTNVTFDTTAPFVPTGVYTGQMQVLLSTY